MRNRPRLLVLFGMLIVAGQVGCGGPGAAPKARVVIFNLVSHPILDASVSGIKKQLIEEGLGPDVLEIQEINANGEMDKIAGIANEILSGRPDVIVPVSTPVAQAVVRAAPQNQNIVFSTVTNPSDIGMDARPGNVSGVSDAVNYEANLRLIREALPNARRIGVVYNAGERNSQFGVEQVRALAPSLGFDLRLVTISSSQEVLEASRAMARQIDAFYVGSDNTVVAAIASLISVARERKIPVFASDSGSVQEGAAAAVSVDYEALGRRAGSLVAEVIRTKKRAGEIPVVTFRGDLLVINPQAASTFNLTLPESILARAKRLGAGQR